MSELSKKDLTIQMNDKNREALLKDGGISSLFVNNLENFAYRYLETSQDTDIKCQSDGTNYWVESTEPNIIEALKWPNRELKEKLINLCKLFPGAQSKKIKTKLVLSTKILNENEVECQASLICLTPKDENNINLIKKNQMKFEDPIELRNKHAALLEEVCELF